MGFRKYQNIDLMSSIEIYILLLLGFFIIRGIKCSIGIKEILLIFYLAFYIFASIFNDAPILEVITATKSHVFLLVFALALPTWMTSLREDEQQLVYRALTLTICLIFVKYSISHIASMNGRPLFFTENNFEVLLPIYVALSGHIKFAKLKLIAALVVFMTLSKSGIVILLFFWVYKLLHKLKWIGMLVSVLGVLIIIIAGFRYFNNLENIDRVQFAIGYLTSLSSVKDFLIGNILLQPLPREVCTSFSYMTDASNIGNGECYSRILHGWILRVLHDFGIIGMGIYLYYVSMTLKHVTGSDRVLLIGVGMLNGLSVSGFGNPFWYLIAMLSVLINASEKNEVVRKIRPAC